MPYGFDIVQRGPGGGPPGGGPPGGGPPGGGPPGGRPPGGRPPGGRPPQRPPVGRPPFRPPIFPVFPVFPPGGCVFIDRFGRCCDRFGTCCDRFGRCCDRFGRCFYRGYPLASMADIDDIWDDGIWDTDDDDDMYEDRVMPAFNEMYSGWDDQY